MPPRPSQRSKRPSAQALKAMVSSPPQRVRRLSVVVNGNVSSSAQQPSLLPEALVGQQVSRAEPFLQRQSQQPSVVPATVQPTILASPAMDQLISRVTDEVTKRLQPLLSNLSSMVQQTPRPPTTSSQAPVEQSTSVQSSGSTFQQVQGLAAIQDTVEVPAVHDGIQSALASLSGEQNLMPGTQRPNDVFMSINFAN